MNILLTHSYFLRFDPKQWQLSQPYAPLGTLYAAAVLREAGHSVSLFDTMFAVSPDEIMEPLTAQQPEIVVICDDGFNYLTKMCLTNMRDAAFVMIRHAKKMGARVIVSSSDSTDHTQQYLTEGADAVIIGEVEQTLVELVQNINHEWADIPGLAFMQKGELIRTPRRSLNRTLDELPFPAHDLVDFHPYKATWQKSKGYFSVNVATTRGCPFKCNWCAKPIYGNRYNHRSPENVVAELQMLQQSVGFEHVWFCDDIFGLHPGWIKEFADLVQRAELKFKFKIQARADILLRGTNIADLAAAGCETIWMGAESGSQRILDAMDKEITVEQIEASTIKIKEHGMYPAFFIQFGYPGETKDDIARTISMINRLLPHEIGISVSYPLPGTKFFEQVKSELNLKSNWTDSDEMALMFRNTYPAAYYKRLHRYVHHTYRRHLAVHNFKQAFRSRAGIASLRQVLSAAFRLPGNLLDRYMLHKLENSL
jgi:anaerobic magnesium-protoporphyrin IX monomethyl ester cyclase